MLSPYRSVTFFVPFSRSVLYLHLTHSILSAKPPLRGPEGENGEWVRRE